MTDPAQRLHRTTDSLGTPMATPARLRWLDRRCRAANVSPQLRQVFGVAPAAGVVSAVVAAAVGAFVVALAVLLALVVLPAVVLAIRRHRRRDAVAAAVPFVLDGLARSLRGGASLTVALRHSATTTPQPLATGLETLVVSLDLGQPLDRAWDVLADRENSDELKGVAALVALLRVGEGGGATALETAARSLRQSAALHRETRALVAQAELSMRVLAVLPAGFVGLGLMFGSDSSTALFTTAFGRLCLLIGGGLELAGLAWMKALLRRVVL